MPAADQSLDDAANEGESAQKFCGIVRPIADMGNYTAKHWREVHNVIAEAVEPLGYTLRLVSESDASGVILTEIVTNLYQDEMVIVDVSGRNPNVMFELGMRLAFEKPAIIVVDDDTPFSFDISPVKHIRYPRTLRYGDIVKFKAEVATAVTATLNAVPDKKNYLQQFGPIKVTELGSQSVEMNAVAQDVQEMKRLMVSVLNEASSSNSFEAWSHRHGYAVPELRVEERSSMPFVEVEIPVRRTSDFIRRINMHSGVSAADETPTGVRVYMNGSEGLTLAEVRNSVRAVAREFRNMKE
jgi:hypothetical protein